MAAAKTKRPRRGRRYFREGCRISGISAAALDNHIQALGAKNGRQATAVDLLDSARPKNSPIHHLYNWDDASAAEEQRLERSRFLLRAVLVEYYIESTKQTVEVRAHLFSPSQKAYMTSDQVFTSEDLRAEALSTALAELRSWQRRHKHLKELIEVFRAIDKLGKKKKN